MHMTMTTVSILWWVTEFRLKRVEPYHHSSINNLKAFGKKLIQIK